MCTGLVIMWLKFRHRWGLLLVADALVGWRVADPRSLIRFNRLEAAGNGQDSCSCSASHFSAFMGYLDCCRRGKRVRSSVGSPCHRGVQCKRSMSKGLLIGAGSAHLAPF
mmetsp:Transcript_39321/g.83153  ORF Transcript_39321/g.83153 Transcript_39321/m.83153 type:complete len:110 (+) Transcript_39321:700-1029(+)